MSFTEVYRINLADFMASFSPDSSSVAPPKTPEGTEEERRERAKEVRKLQVLNYHQREAQLEELERGGGGEETVAARRKRQRGGNGRRKVCFQPRERLRDAVVRSDQGECEC